MKRIYLRVALLLSVVIVFVTGCASDTDLAGDSPIKSGGTVPGEKTGEEGVSATAGPGSAAAGVHW